MISLRVGDCKVDILPVVSGLVSESQKVRDAYGKYEAYAVSLGIEGVEAVRRRKEIPEDLYEISELDIVYAERMSYFGEVEAPSPAFCELIDLCTADGISVIPLDMKEIIVLAVIVSAAAPLGDYGESMIKRCYGQKDSSNLIPGHGGFFDRFDSCFFAMPAAYHFFELIIRFL